MMLDTTDAVPNGIIRVFGRNMRAPGGVTQVPVVRLLNGTTYSTATVTASSAYSLSFRVPSTVKSGSTYRVFVRNGPGGPAGEVECPQQVVGLANQRDMLKLGIPWATAMRFTSNVYNVRTDSRLTLHAQGDGVSNDAPAIRDAIAAAKAANGGIVYLPAGTYRSDDGAGIQIPSNVVLKGDGPGATILQFGYRFTPSNPAGNDNWWLSFDVGDLAGVMGMTFQNQNTGPVANQTIGRHWYSNPHAHRFFFSNVDAQLGNGSFIYLEGTFKGVMQDCNVTTTNMSSGQQGAPILLNDSDQWTIRRSTFNYRVGRVYVLFSKHVVFEQNTLNRDNNYSGVVEAGGIETSFSSQVVIQNNTVQGVGPINRSTKDGEMIMSQKSTVADTDDVGQVTGATASTLTNSARSWPGLFTPPSYPTGRSVVAIIGGKGMGQWRNVTSHTGSQLTVSSPWAVVPNSTSSYSLTTFSNYQQYILGNTVNNSSMGIQFYDGACDSVIDGNNVNNAASIMLRAWDVAFTPNGSNRRHNVGWNVTINNNTVTNSDGVHMAQIILGALVNGGVSYGNLILGTEVRNNTVLSYAPVQYEDEMGNAEGFWNQVVFEGYYDGRSDPNSNLGTIFQGNASNLSNWFHDVGAGQTTQAAGVSQGA